MSLLERMATVYHVSFTSLLAPARPPSRRRPTDHRTIGGRAPTTSPETAIAISTAQLDQELITKLLSELDDSFRPTFPAASIDEDDPEQLGLAERLRLGVTDDEQFSWADAGEAFRQWRWRVEQEGVFVFVRPMPREDCRGFALWEEPYVPAIVINTREASQARLFTLLHEYGHILLGASGICIEADRGPVEVFCNRFAAAALMPRSTVTRALESLNLGGEVAWEDDDVRRLARRLRVSKPAAAIRLERLGFAPRGVLESLNLDWNEDSWTSGGGGPVPQPRQVVNRLGDRYVEVVLTALDRGAIDLIGADEYLGARAIHLPDIREEVAARLRRHSAVGDDEANAARRS